MHMKDVQGKPSEFCQKKEQEMAMVISKELSYLKVKKNVTKMKSHYASHSSH